MRCGNCSGGVLSGRAKGLRPKRAAVWLGLILASKSAVGETALGLREATSGTPQPNGLQVNGLSSYLGAFSLGTPANATPVVRGLPRGFIAGGGVAASLGWYSTSASKRISVAYDGSYDGNLKDSALNSLNHLLLFDYRAKLAPRFDFAVAAVAESTGLSEYVFRSSGEPGVVRQSGSPEEFAGAVLGGTFSSQIPALPLADLSRTDSPLTALIADSRLESGSVSMKFFYSQSRRTHWFWGIRASRNIPKASSSPERRSGLLFPSYSDGAAYEGFTYSLSRQTDIGAEIEYDRTHSAHYATSTTRFLANLGHRMTKHWLMRIEAGAGTLAQLRSVVYTPRRLDYEAAAALGYRSAAHSVLASVHRSIGDRHGLGAGETLTSGLAWSWQRPGGAWALAGSGGYERVGGRGVRRTEGWVAHAGLTRRITPHTHSTIEYVHTSDAGQTGLGFTNLARRAARVSLVWSPVVGSLR